MTHSVVAAAPDDSGDAPLVGRRGPASRQGELESVPRCAAAADGGWVRHAAVRACESACHPHRLRVDPFVSAGHPCRSGAVSRAFGGVFEPARTVAGMTRCATWAPFPHRPATQPPEGATGGPAIRRGGAEVPLLPDDRAGPGCLSGASFTSACPIQKWVRTLGVDGVQGSWRRIRGRVTASCARAYSRHCLVRSEVEFDRKGVLARTT